VARGRRDDLPGMPGGLGVSPDGRTVGVVTLGMTPEDHDRVLMLDAATGSTSSEVGLPEVNQNTGGTAPRLWADAGWTDAGRFLAATDDGILRFSDRGHLLGRVAWPTQVFDDGSFLVWPDGEVSVRDLGSEAEQTVVLDSERPAVRPRDVPGTVRAVDAGADTLAVTTSSASGAELQLVDARTAEPLSGAWPADPETEVVLFSPDGDQLLVGAGETVELRDGATGAPGRELSGHNGGVSGGAFAGPGDDLLWTAGRDGTAVGFDLTGRRGVFATTRTPDRSWLGEGAPGADTVVWTDRVETDVNHAYLLRPGEQRGRQLESGLDSCVCDATSSDLTADGAVALVGYTPIRTDLQPVTDQGYVVAWDTRTLEVLGVVETPWPVFAVDSSADGERAVVLGGGGWGTLDLTDLDRSDRLERVVDLETWVRQGTGTSLVEVAPDGDRAVLLVEGDVLLVGLTGELLERRRIETGATGYAQSAAWTTDGSTLVVGTTNGWFHVLDGSTLEAVAPRRLVTSGVLVDVEVSPDGTMAATIGPEGDVTLWDTGTWRPYGQPLFGDRSVGFLRFRSEEAVLEVRFSDQTVSRVAVDLRAWVAAACQAAARDLTADEWAVVRPGEEPRSTCDRDETGG
jgi:WD40 repeat protein